jgi:hypothetical protein
MAGSGQSNRRSWPIDALGAKYLAVRAEDLRANEQPLSVQAALKAIERAVNHPTNSSQLIELGKAVARSGVRATETVNLHALTWAFQAGELVLLTRAEKTATRVLETGASVAEQLKAAHQVKTWVEFEVLDMEDNPIPDKKYLCVLPNGSVQEGALDGTGKVRFDDIDPGNCVFVLTELDQEAWERVL